MRLLPGVLLASLPLCGALSAFHSIELKNGSAVRGGVVFERADSVYVDLGYDVIEIPTSSIASMQKRDEETGEFPHSKNADSTLYEVSADRDDHTIRDWVDELGEAVALVQTPTGLGSGFVIHEDGYIVTNDHVIAGEHRIAVTIFEEGKNELTKVTYASTQSQGCPGCCCGKSIECRRGGDAPCRRG